MKILSGIENFPQLEAPRVLAVGTFDGVHLGHRAIVREVIGRADKGNSRSAVLTFDPHPQLFLRRGGGVSLLSSSEEKAELLRQMGLDCLLVLRFDRTLASMEAEEFVRGILHARLKVSQVVVGYSHRFGRDRKGSPSLLRTLGHQLGFEVTVVEPVIFEGAAVTSTRIRDVLSNGEVASAAGLLCRYYSLQGRVSPGERRGSVLAYPTANLKVDPPEKLIPKVGVYAVSVDFDGERFAGMMNIGVRPTFGGGPRVVEVHLFDFSGDLYGRTIEVSFLQRLRDEFKFDSEEALRLQMEQDEEKARRILESALPEGESKKWLTRRK